MELEVGTVSANHNPAYKKLSRFYSKPDVLGQVQTYAGSDRCWVRFKEIGNDYIKVCLEEPYEHDGPHVTETIGYLVVNNIFYRPFVTYTSRRLEDIYVIIK